MAKCSVCGKEAIYCAKYEGRCYCKEHFIKWFEGRVRSTIRRFSFFGKREKIAVAVSGGKDSMAALHFLLKLSKKVPGWDIVALHIDEGIKGYREHTRRFLERYCEENNVELHVFSFKEFFGQTLDEIVEFSKSKGLPYLPCTYCGVFRRYLINMGAKKVGATVVVTAHNLDDVVQTFLMNILRGDVERISRLGPKTEGEHLKFVRRVKLFYEIPEKETALYAYIHNLYPPFVECPYAPTGLRWDIRQFINKMEERTPGTKFRMLRALLDIVTLSKKTPRLRTCKICGEPSSGEICRACQLRLELGLDISLPP